MQYLVRKKNTNGIYYLYLINSTFDPNTKKQKQKIVQSFGQLDSFMKNNPKEYAELQQKFGNKRERNRIYREQAVTQLLQESKNSASDLNRLLNAKHLMPQNFAHLALLKLWNDDLLMSRHFYYLVRSNKIKVEFNISEIALYFSMLRMVYPSSYLEGLEVSPRFLGDPMNEYSTDDVYRCISLLAKHKDSIMKHVNKRINSLVKRDKSLLFFDCTNCYFETPYNDTYWYRKKALRKLRRELEKSDDNFKNLSKKEFYQIVEESPVYTKRLEEIISSFGDPMRMHGPSKEKRHDLPLVSIALVIDEHAIPIDFKVFAGNQAETSVMIKIIKDLKAKHNIHNAILVADSALNSTKNLSKLLDEKMGFSVAKSALSFNNEIRKNELDLKTFEPMKDEAGNDTSLLYKIIDYKNTKYDRTELTTEGKSTKYVINCNLMITFSKDRYNRDIAVLEDNINRAKKAIATKEQIKASNTGWKALVNVSGDSENTSFPDNKQVNNIETTEDNDVKNSQNKKNSQITRAISLNEDIIEKRKQCAGFAGILFREPPDSKESLSPSYVSTLYHHLVSIEECFRIMKHDLEIRPAYVRNDQSIKGHVLICVLSLIMIRLIQRKFAEEGYSVTVQQIQQCLENLKLMILTMDGQHCVYLNTLEAEKRCCLRSQRKTNTLGDNEFKEKLLKILDCGAIEFINTIDQLRSNFHVKKLSISGCQDELLKKHYSNANMNMPK